MCVSVRDSEYGVSRVCKRGRAKQGIEGEVKTGNKE
jgi:hypothetical protein